MIEVDAGASVLRLDDDGLATLLASVAAAADPDPELVAALDAAGTTSLLDAALLDTAREPEVVLDLVVAGTSTMLAHRAWVDPDRAVLVLGVRPGSHQVMVIPPGHLAAALVRMTRLRPRRTGPRAPRSHPSAGLAALVSADEGVRASALGEVDAGFAWRLGVAWADSGRSEITAIDGRDGLFWADEDALHPVSNTTAYRAFATVLTAGEEPSGH